MTIPSYSNIHVWGSSSSWTVPSGWDSGNNIIACISAGGNGRDGGGGGGGGGYAHIQNFVASPGQIFYFQVGGAAGDQFSNGGNSWINLGTNAQPSSNTNGIYTVGGACYVNGSGGGYGQLGTVNRSGGAGVYGGGGAAGYYGNGGAGNAGGGTDGGYGDGGNGGTSGGYLTGGSGGNGSELWGGYGAGGGGGYISGSTFGGDGGYYGGGGGGASSGNIGRVGRQGIVFICYNVLIPKGFYPALSFAGIA